MSVLQVFVASLLTALVAVVVVNVYPNYPSGRLGVLFYCCTSSHKDRREFKATREGVGKLSLSPDSRVNVVIHGYTESSFRTWVLNLTDALLATEPDNMVILVDYWDLLTISRPYMMANVRQAADETAHLLDLLVQTKGIQLENVHLIGFSLGGRISGLVGTRVKSGTLGRITGIDASYPWLSLFTNEEFLDAGDAALVVNLRTSPIGSLSPPGHIDFIANDGHTQPGCSVWYYLEIARNVCSHYRAVWIMVEAVTSGGDVFPACKCDSWESFANRSCACDIINHFGLSPNTSAHGNFYFSTNAASPFSIPLEQRH